MVDFRLLPLSSVMDTGNSAGLSNSFILMLLLVNCTCWLIVDVGDISYQA